MIESCLICGGNEGVALHSLTGFTDNGPCSDQLHVILLLRKVLKVRKCFLESLLQSSGKHPASWDLKLCNICHRVFEEASFVSLRLKKLNQDFEDLSETLRTRVKGEDVEEDYISSGGGGKRPGRKRQAAGPAKRKVGGGGFDEDGGGVPFKIRKEVMSLTARSSGVAVVARKQVAVRRHPLKSSKRKAIGGEVHDGPLKFEGKPIKTEKQSDVEDDQDNLFNMNAGYQSPNKRVEFEGMPLLTKNLDLDASNDDLDFLAINNEELDDPVENDDNWNDDGSDEAAPKSEDDEDSDYDDDYKPRSRRRKKSEAATTSRNRPRAQSSSNKYNEGLILTPKKIEDGETESFSCPDCNEAFQTFEFCNQHILQSHYGGKWPPEFACHLCNPEDNIKFKKEYFLERHINSEHPGGKLPAHERLERLIEEGVIPDVTYKVVPLSKGKASSSGATRNNLQLVEEPLPNELNVPVLQDDDTLRYLIYPGEISQVPDEVLKLLERDPEGKLCPHCDKLLPSEIQLQAHLKTVHEGEQNCYACTLCSKAFEAIVGLVDHLHQTHSIPKRYSCEKCGETFNLEMSLQAHIHRNHYGITHPFKCLFCSRRFVIISRLNRHLGKWHQVRIEALVLGNEGRCGRMGKSAQFRKRGRRKLKPISITCDLCEDEGQTSSNFGNQEALEVHIKRKHMGIPRPYACNICDKQKYSTPAKLEKHMVLHHTVRSDVNIELGEEDGAQEPSPYMCFPCGRGFKTEKNYQIHMQGKYHNDDRPHVCEICSQAFREIYYLKHHQTLKHYKELNLTPNVCSFCQKMFASPRSLNDHVKTLHTKDARFKCPHCPMFFQYKVVLNKHVNSLHTKKDVFMCTECPKQFFASCNLKEHQARVHSGVKPYECKFCSKKFSDKSTYNRHVEAHSNIIHDCPHCGKTGFKTRHSLRTHVRAAHEGFSRSRRSATTEESDLPGEASNLPKEEETWGF